MLKHPTSSFQMKLASVSGSHVPLLRKRRHPVDSASKAVGTGNIYKIYPCAKFFGQILLLCSIITGS